MPCFKGLAVSIHTPDGPLPEYAIQKQSRLARISSYIPVPPPRIPKRSTDHAPEQSTFAISITLLTPGLAVPYSAPKSTPDTPYPKPRTVGGLPTSTERGRYISPISPYIPLTTSPNETIAAYIYFDGRPKEEVATLLRRGEETWVNSRWVGVPLSEGGGLAEREFLFREVGLERWLNGLDLDGKDAAAKIEKRRQKMEKKRRRKKHGHGSDDEAESSILGGRDRAEKGVLRYGADSQSPLEQMSDTDEIFFSASDSDDDPIPESAGQIKVALYRVLASGEIRRGEYSPQFGAHDGDEDIDKDEDGDTKAGGETEEVDHTTSFAQPKSLDPKSISTQTVTGIDPQDKPFAVFTFLYRGEKQLQKMSILPTSPRPSEKSPATDGKRRSMQADFAKLKPLNPNGLRGFADFRDPNELSEANGEKKDKMGKRRQTDEDSDEDLEQEANEEVVVKAEEAESRDVDLLLSPEDAKRQGELADGVQKIRLKRQHSADALSTPSPAPTQRRSPPSNTPTAGSSPPYTGPASGSPPPLLPSVAFDMGSIAPSDSVGSPLKKQRASLSADDEDMRKRFGLGLSGVRADVLGAIEVKQHDRMANGNNVGPVAQDRFAFGGKLQVSGGPLIEEEAAAAAASAPSETPGPAAAQSTEKPMKSEEMEEVL